MSKVVNPGTVKRHLFCDDNDTEVPAAQSCPPHELARSDQGEICNEFIELRSGVNSDSQAEHSRHKRRKCGDERSPFRSPPVESLALRGPSVRFALANDMSLPNVALPVNEIKRNSAKKNERGSRAVKPRRRKLAVDNAVLEDAATNSLNPSSSQSLGNQGDGSVFGLPESTSSGINVPLTMSKRSDQSAGVGDAELLASVRELDAQLEESAKVHNLKPINVKTILHVRGNCSFYYVY